jgi:hypothetical protein
MKRLVLLAVALIALVATASASARDRNRDGIPDRWEAHHHLSTTRNVANRDPDRDHLSNLAEFRDHTNPRDADTDNDGVDDGDEVAEHTNPRTDDSDNDGTDDGAEIAGHVKSFDGTTLVITLNDNSDVSGTVTDSTEIKCEGNEDAQTSSLRDEGSDHESGGDDNSGPSLNSGPGNAGDDQGENEDDQGENEDGGQACGKADLAPGATVHEADLKTTSLGKVFEEVELVK